MSAATVPAPAMPGEKIDKGIVKGPIVSLKKEVKKKQKTAVDELTAEEREAVTIVFHQFETGLREGTIFTKVEIAALILFCPVSTEFIQGVPL